MTGSGDAIEAWGIPLRRGPLAMLRLKALRCGAWFSRLKGDERRYMELVIRVVDRVCSPRVVKLLAPLIKKLLDAMGGIEALEGKVAHRMKTVGRSLARKISLIAQGWGNKSAVRWLDEPGFIRYLTIMDMNLPPMFKV